MQEMTMTIKIACNSSHASEAALCRKVEEIANEIEHRAINALHYDYGMLYEEYEPVSYEKEIYVKKGKIE